MSDVPKFRSDKKEAEFWDKHNLTDYLDDLKEVPLHIKLSEKLKTKLFSRRQKKLLTLRLEQGQIDAAKLVASNKSIPYQTLIRMWIMEGINREIMPCFKNK